MKFHEKTDLLVIGSGPGGHTAALLAAKANYKVILIEKNNLGGVCLNEGCIPSKALIHATHILKQAKQAEKFGIDFAQPHINLSKLRQWNENIISRLKSGLKYLCTQKHIKYIQGEAVFLNSNTVEIKNTNKKITHINFNTAIIATGAKPLELDILPASKKIMYANTALNLNDIPESLLIIGGGYIGLEIGSIYAGLGSKVSIVEVLPTILKGIDTDIRNVVIKRLRKIFVEVLYETTICNTTETPSGLQVEIKNKYGHISQRQYEKILAATGRIPNSEGLGLENTRVKIDTNGFIKRDKNCRTNDNSIYAIGDVSASPMLAHKASYEARIAISSITGNTIKKINTVIPAVIFTDPEIAICGTTEKEAIEKGIEIKIGKFPWAACGRAITMGQNDGLTKIIAEAKTNRIIGASIVGHSAGELIAETVVAIQKGIKADEFKTIIHPHPTLSETIMEAGLDIINNGVYSL